MKSLLMKIEAALISFAVHSVYGLALYGLAYCGRCHRHMYPEQL